MRFFDLCYNKNMEQKGEANIFVIILGVFILIILLGYFKNNRVIVFKKDTTTTKQAVDQKKYNPNTSYPYFGCGIQIDTPMPTTQVSNIFEFAGQVTGCGWNSQNGFIGTLEVLDSNNYSLTDVISVPVAADGRFKVTVGLKRQPSNNLGLIYLRSVDGLQVASFTIYLK